MKLEGVVQDGLIVPDDATGSADGTRVRISTATPAYADALAMLRQWAAEDATLTDAEADANAAALRAIDAARPSERKLFTDLLAPDNKRGESSCSTPGHSGCSPPRWDDTARPTTVPAGCRAG